jgi:predicted TIM-barrel fold metal-dependent hydrolase
MVETLNPVRRLFEGATPEAAGNKLPDRMISADSHVVEPPHTYSKYIDPAFRDRAPKIVRDRRGGDAFEVEGMPLIVLGSLAAAGIDPREISPVGHSYDQLHRGGSDPKARLADQDRDGIAAEVIYPSVGMVLCNHADADFKQACMWAYNRWLHEEFVGHAPDRLIGLGQTAVRSVAEAVDDLHRMKEMGFRGVMLPGNPATAEDYDDPSFDPLWRASVELDMPVSFHILTSRSDGRNGTSPPASESDKTGMGNWRGGVFNGPQAVLKSIQDIIGLFIWGHVFERNPELKLICVEADAGWLPHYAYRMDHMYDRHRFWLKMDDMRKRPSEQLANNVFLTFQDDITVFRLVGLIDPHNLMWANDFPHSDSTWPWSQEMLGVQTAHLSEEDKALILRDNAARLYGIDVAALPSRIAA